MTHERYRPLPTVAPGEHVQVMRITAGQQATRRLHALGLVPGAELHMLQSPGYGPLLLAIGDSRLAVEHGIAQKVLVQPIQRQTSVEQPPLNEQEGAAWHTA